MLSILSQTTSHLLNTKNDQQLQSSEMDLDLPPTTISTPTTSNDTLGETINVLLGSIQALNDDTQRHSSESLRTQYSLQILSENLSKLKLSIQDTNASIGGFKPNQQILQQDIDSLKEDLEDQQATSYDGTLIWRITDVQKKMGM